jgi:uncharacterized membrane protein YphA (DoxX/SURF4 family)
MNAVVWAVQVVLAVAFLTAGALKLTQPRAKLSTTLAWVEDFSNTQVRGIGLVELAAAFGLILPGTTRVAPVLTPLAAVGLILVMVGATATHLRRHEPQLVSVNTVVVALAMVVVWGRFGPYSL